MFQPDVGLALKINGLKYIIAGHPATPKLPYGQEGKQAIVFKVDDEAGNAYALKVFKPRYRKPYLVTLTERMQVYSDLIGMEVCRRKIISPLEHSDLLKDFPDLAYAVLMPWIEGPTWAEKLLSRKPIMMEDSLYLARYFLRIMISLEEKGLSHGDLSGMNVMIPYFSGGEGISLVDVEQLYIPGMEKPEVLAGQSPGYSFPDASALSWGPYSDRFAGSVILAEILCFCEKDIVKASWGESYFAPDEMGQDCRRYQLVEETLSRKYGKETASIFRRAWFASQPESCPSFAEWYIYLPEKARETEAPEGEVKKARKTETFSFGGQKLGLQGLLDYAYRLTEEGDFRGAIEIYQYLLADFELEQDSREQIGAEIERLRKRLADDGWGKTTGEGEEPKAETFPMAYQPAVLIRDAEIGVADESEAAPEPESASADIPETGIADIEVAAEKPEPSFLVSVGARRQRMKKAMPIALALILIIAAVAATVLAIMWGSKSTRNVTVPDLVGLTLEEAQLLLKDFGLEVGDIRYEPREGTEAGRVLESEPPAGTQVATSQKIGLLLSGEALVELPDLSGLSQEEALAKLQSLGLNPEILNEQSDAVQSGFCIRTEPAAGSNLAVGSTIRLIVSSGPQTQPGGSTCPTCGGSGNVSCTTCGGRGFVYVSTTGTCSRCGGRGYVTCTKCKGEGFLSNGMVCDVCGGRGTVVCPGCGGSGRATTQVRQTCPTCGGSGKVRCPTCGGTGKVP